MTYSAIADVSNVLIDLLKTEAEDERNPLNPRAITLASPAETDSLSNVELALYPYQLATDNSRGSVSTITSGTARQDPPLSLAIRYLLTAYDQTGDDSNDGDDRGDPLDRQRRLGAALQVFHDHSQIEPEAAPLALLQEETLSVTVVDEPLDELLSLWSQYPNATYQPSATIEVRPVVIQSLNEETFTRVEDRETDIGRHTNE